VNKKYDESTIKSLDALAHIRLRTGMYIGRLGDGSHHDDGIYILLKEIIDNGIDEWIMGHGKKIDVHITEEGCVQIRDYGRGIPLGKLVDCVSKINTGAKYNDDVFQFSVGLNGVGTKAVNALSSYFKVVSFRDGKSMEACFSQGVLKNKTSGKTKELNGTFIEFIPDNEIFKKWNFESEYVLRRLYMYAYLNRGLVINYNGQKIVSEEGLLDLIRSEIGEGQLYEPFSFREKKMEFAFTHTQDYGETHYSFINGQYTSDGGTHLIAFREGLLKGINEYAKKNFQSVDIRDGLIATVLVRLKDPVFESQTKNKLGNPEIKQELVKKFKSAVVDLLYSDPGRSNKLVERLIFNEKLRKELASVKKEAKEKQKKISLKIPKLRDCRYHYSDNSLMGNNTMIFLTEGVSASASIVSTRNPLTQAVFSLRGKPMNVYGMKQDQLYRNEELFNLMSAVGLEEVDSLRYNKIILATDADVDGLHIRNLLITYFLTYFEGLVQNGHLFILETPLFRVRNKKESIYCFNEEEKEEAIKKLGERSNEVTRFKGLGELSPHEFKNFIGEGMRILPVTINKLAEVKPTLEFYMGKNTPKRKQFIMDSLTSDY
jgi:topoisomerase IV subunit B